jgi:hypothetical protein
VKSIVMVGTTPVQVGGQDATYENEWPQAGCVLRTALDRR